MIGLLLASAALAQKPQPASASPSLQNGAAAKASPAADYSKEPFVIEYLTTKVTFANDGTSVSDTTARIHIQSQAGVQNFGLITFPYASANASVEIPYVRVRKADGTTVPTPPENIQDMPANITRSAPFYSDIREKQVAVKALDSGDVLEYEYRIQLKNPLIPGQFWYSYDFFKAGIVLDEELQISLPQGRYVNVQSTSIKPTISDQPGDKLYRWKTANLREKSENEKAQAQQAEEPPPPAVQLTTFHSWDEVGQWFRGLEQPRVAATPEIRAKEAELTRGATTDSQKLHAIYDYVSLKIRYIGIAFGIGRYQPHAAADVLSNEYGDCKDKQTLLTSLLAAAGVNSYPALINSSRKIDPALPSPGQFDHVIAVVPEGNDFQWLDTTAEVAPFGFLAANLRDDEALVIPDKGPAHLVRTPADPPFNSTFDFHMDGKLSDAGTLDARAQASFRGDAEFLLRTAFRLTPQPQWKDVIQRLSYSWNFAGDVSDISASPPDATGVPFQFNYSYTRKDYSDWADKRISPALPPLFLPDVDDKAQKDANPIKLGAVGNVSLNSAIALPADYTPTVPSPVNIVEDFAEYHAKYSFSNGVLDAQRTEITKVREIPASRHDDYAKFLKSVRDDENNFISLQQVNAAVQYQPNPEAQKLYEQAREAWQQQDVNGALDDFQRAVTIDPKYGLAWTAMGMTHMALGNMDQGLDEMKKAIAVDPKTPYGYKALAAVQLRLRRPEDALDTWEQLEKADRQDADAPMNVGTILISLNRYKEAVPELETSVKQHPTNARLFDVLGLAYTKTNDPDKAMAAFTQALQLDPSPLTLNDVAFYLADANLHLDLALTDGEKAVEQEENLTSKISLDSLAYSDLQQMSLLAAYWDTLGWVHFRSGHLEQAEKFIAAAWKLSQTSELGGHLGQIYEKEGKTQQAEQLYAFALASSPLLAISRTLVSVPVSPGSSPLANQVIVPTQGSEMSETRARLAKLLKSDSRVDEAVSKAHDNLSELRTIRLPKITSKSATAQFFILFAAGPKVVAVKYLSGADELRDAGKYLNAAKFNVSFPNEGAATRLVRRGVLDCEPELPYCQFILIPPGSVHSLN